MLRSKNVETKRKEGKEKGDRALLRSRTKGFTVT